MPTELRKLFEKYCRLAAQLPHENDLNPDDHQVMADCEMTLREMAEVQAQIEAFGRQHHRPK